MRTVNVPNLSAAFTGTFLTIAGMNSIAAAQEALFDATTIGASDPDLDPQPDPLFQFKPEFCATIDDTTSDAVINIATTDSLFSAVHEWKDTPQAHDILTYRMCQQEDLSRPNDAVLSDVFIRTRSEDFLHQAMMPFIEADPAILQRVRNWGVYDLPVEVVYSWQQDMPMDEPNAAEPETPRVRITYDEDVFFKMASAPERAQYVFRYIDELDDFPNIEKLLKDAVRSYPLALLNYGQVVQEFLGDEDLQYVGPHLLEASHDASYASGLLSSYEDYAFLPEARDIAQNAAHAAPLSLFRAIREDRLSAALTEEGVLTIEAEKLLELAQDRNSASSLIDYYEYYNHLPEARAIAQTAIQTDSLYFLRMRDKGNLHPLLAADRTLKISGQSLLDDARQVGRRGNERYFYHFYDSYAHLPEAAEIMRTVIQADPFDYYSYQRAGDLHVALQSSEFSPTMDDLWTYLNVLLDGDRQSYLNFRKIYRHYEAYEDLEGADAFIQTVIDMDPNEFYQGLQYEDDGNLYINAKGFTPSYEALIQQAKVAREASTLIGYYHFYADMPQAIEILQTAINADPLGFAERMSQKRDYSEASQARHQIIRQLWNDGHINFPSAETMIEHWDSYPQRYGLVELLSAYKHFSNEEAAWQLVRSRIDENPQDALRRLMRMVVDNDGDRFISSWHRNPLPEDIRDIISARYDVPEDLALKVFLYMMAEYADVVEKRVSDGHDAYFSALIFAHRSEDPEFMTQILDAAEDNPGIVLKLFQNAQQIGFISEFDETAQDRLSGFLERHMDELSMAAEREGGIESLGQSRSLWRFIQASPAALAGGLVNKETVAQAVKLYIQQEPQYAIRDLDENPELIREIGFNSAEMTDVVQQAVYQTPLYFIAQATENELAADLKVLGVTIPYAELLSVAQQDFKARIQNEDRGHDWTMRHVITTMNNLHNYPAETRFAILDDAPEGTYLKLATFDDGSFYTSTFNHIMDGLLAEMAAVPDVRQKLWEANRYWDAPGQTVLKNATQYGRLDDFLAALTREETMQAIDVALDTIAPEGRRLDSFNRISETQSVLMETTAGLLTHIAAQNDSADVEAILVNRFVNERRTDNRTALGLAAALYSNNVETTTQHDFFEKVQSIYMPHLNRYMQTDMDASMFFDEQGRNFQMMVFYDDDDGHSSFWHFKSKYNQDRRWRYRDHGSFISYTRDGVHLYANKPDHEITGNEDIRAHVEEQGGVISFLVHRGHSYHVTKTARNYLNEDIQFFWLGSCRSSAIWDYIDDAPNMQFIYSNNVGTMRVNDPLLKEINDTLADRNNVDWMTMRAEAFRLSGGSREARSYVFPDGSLEYGLRMVQSLYNGDPALARQTQAEMLDVIYETATATAEEYVESPYISVNPAMRYGMQP